MNKQQIDEYIDFYTQTQGLLPEELQEYRLKYRKEGLDREDLYNLAYESSTRSAHHVKKNPEKICREVVDNIEGVEGDFSKIAMITSLKGFKAPTASVILTVINPEKHAVVDTRVWASLERFGYVKGRKESFNALDYCEMINSIREIAEKTGFTTEEVGYSLFAYDVDKREGNLH
jgi:thermostable 8-oxoguanine DNA glycosylase